MVVQPAVVDPTAVVVVGLSAVAVGAPKNFVAGETVSDAHLLVVVVVTTAVVVVPTVEIVVSTVVIAVPTVVVVVPTVVVVVSTVLAVVLTVVFVLACPSENGPCLS